jgi:hypothetical protein
MRPVAGEPAAAEGAAEEAAEAGAVLGADVAAALGLVEPPVDALQAAMTNPIARVIGSGRTFTSFIVDLLQSRSGRRWSARVSRG